MNFPTLTPAKHSCSKCNKPCIIVNGRCQIAKIRIALDCSFNTAYNLLTGIGEQDYKKRKELFKWQKQGEPMPLDFQI